METKGTKRACGLCLTKCGLGLKRIAKMLVVAHPAVYRWRKLAGISGQVGPRMGNGVLVGTSAYRPEKHQEEAFRIEQAIQRVEYRRVSWGKHPECLRHAANGVARRIYQKNRNIPWKRALMAVRFRTWMVCKNQSVPKASNSMRLLGCSPNELRSHLQMQFKRGMGWHNYGTHWEVDHIVPCFSFDLSKPDEQKRCFHFSNLRPLEVSANRRRPKRLTAPMQACLGI